MLESECKNNSVVLSFNLNELQVNIDGVVKRGDKTEKLQVSCHVGMIMDSFIIKSEDDKVDIRFLWPRLQNYMLDLADELKLFLQNDGENELYFRFDFGTIRINPGERKEVCKENIDLSEKMNILESMIAYAKEVGREKDE